LRSHTFLNPVFIVFNIVVAHEYACLCRHVNKTSRLLQQMITHKNMKKSHRLCYFQKVPDWVNFWVNIHMVFARQKWVICFLRVNVWCKTRDVLFIFLHKHAYSWAITNAQFSDTGNID
jgi:hypothetical protein